MKYWLLQDGDAVGPYDPEELKRLPGFTADSMICPDGAASADQWKPAQFYLIRPPTVKPQEQGPGAKGGKMGRIAAAELEEARVEAPVSAAPRAEPRAAGRKLSAAALFSALAALAAAGAGLKLMRKPAAAPQSAPAAAPAPAPAAASGSAPSQPASGNALPAGIDANLLKEAVDFAKSFPVQSDAPKQPVDAADVLEPARWRAPKTVGEALERRGLSALALNAAAEAQKRGKSPAEARREIARDRAGWSARADRWLKRNAALRWSAEPGAGSRWRVDALFERRGGTDESMSFEADILKRTLKPLDLEAWLAVDPRGAARWADKNVPLGEAPAPGAVAAASHPYEIERPRVTPKKARAPKADPKETYSKSTSAPEGPADDIGEDPVGDLEPAEKAAERPAPASEPPPEEGPPHSQPRMETPKPKLRPPVAQAGPESKPESTAPPEMTNPRPVAKAGPNVKPVDEKAMLERALGEVDEKSKPDLKADKKKGKKEPPPDLDDGEPKKKRKNAMDMSVDELNSYLGGGEKRFQ